VNEAGQPAWMSASFLQLLRKVCGSMTNPMQRAPLTHCIPTRLCCHAAQAITLSQLALYLDVDRPLMALPRGLQSW
jgi:hypothetical protein